MTDNIVQDWLTDFAAITSVEIHSYASSLQHNDEVIRALYSILEDRYKNPSVFDLVCNQLLLYYRSTEIELHRFTLQFLPTLIYIYLNAVAHGDKKSCRSVETLLISVYNLEVVDKTGQPVVISFRLPSLAQASIYHEPMSLAHASLTENALRRLEECNIKLVTWGPLPQVETLNAQNRLKIMTALLFIFNRHIGTLNKTALKILCKISSQLVTQGFLKPNQVRTTHPNDNNFVPRLLPRIPVSPQFLLEIVTGLYYAMYNDYGYIAFQSIEDVHNRSCFECYADVILVTTAVKNSSHVTSTGRPGEGPMGISVALSPATTTVTTVKKSMITNASFRTKKLPDDLDANLFDDIPSAPVSRGPSFREMNKQIPEQEKETKVKKGKHKSWIWSRKNSLEDQEVKRKHSNDETKHETKNFNLDCRINWRRFSDATFTKQGIAEESNHCLTNSDSPKRRLLTQSNLSSPNRMSAGAKLCKVFENESFEDGSNTLYICGKPNSLNVLETPAII